ncbi:LLM class flavin-dependent oxidoreductase [Saccharopolyspora sp. NPDC000359]|uniref:LLM class flavin-dependent oxidoreductase n=1 Tax=Saccharopolyspora sp. NPDC000359 TaxID=3154251 RepID=UPI0033291E26
MTTLLFARLTAPLEGGETGRAAFARARDWARAAHRAGIDAVLLDDRQCTGPDGARAFEAGTLAAALAVSTEGIGLVPTISTGQLAPYHVARLLATIDYLSGGRAGWEVRAPGDEAEAANYRAGDVGGADRQLARAEEFAQVLAGLWDSFQDDAFLRDRESGIYFLPERLHALNHVGEHFDVAGPLNIARPPQGHPVLVKRITGTGTAEFAGRVADVAVVPNDQAEEVAEIRHAVTAAATGAGRRPEDVRILLEQSADTPVEQLTGLAGSGLVDGFTLSAPDADALVDSATAVRRHLPAASGGTLRARLGLPRPVGKQPVA